MKEHQAIAHIYCSKLQRLVRKLMTQSTLLLGVVSLTSLTRHGVRSRATSVHIARADVEEGLPNCPPAQVTPV